MTRKITAIIADDEPSARQSVAVLLSKTSDIEIIAQCKDGKETATSVLTLKPDLLFLDIQMPELNGFEVLEAIREDFVPAIIFITAFDQFAVKAFEKSAIDYLLKPYDDERFYKSVEKGREWINLRNSTLQSSRLEQLLTEIKAPGNYARKLIIKNRTQITFAPVDTIMFIESEGNFVKLHTCNEIKLANYTFKQLEDILDHKVFVRVHKSFILNVNFVEMIESHFHGDYIVTMKQGEKIKLSRNYKEALDLIIKES